MKKIHNKKKFIYGVTSIVISIVSLIVLVIAIFIRDVDILHIIKSVLTSFTLFIIGSSFVKVSINKELHDIVEIVENDERNQLLMLKTGYKISNVMFVMYLLVKFVLVIALVITKMYWLVAPLLIVVLFSFIHIVMSHVLYFYYDKKL